MKVLVVLCLATAVVNALPSSIISESLGSSSTPGLVKKETSDSVAASTASTLSHGFSSISSSTLDKLKAELPSKPIVSLVDVSASDKVTPDKKDHEESSPTDVKAEPASSPLGLSPSDVPPPVVESVNIVTANVPPPRVTSDLNKYSVSSVGSDNKKVSSPEPEIEAADPSAGALPSSSSSSSSSPIKKIPFYVPVEHAAAYKPENFFNPYPLGSPLGMGTLGAPAAPLGLPYRSMVSPWYRLVSSEVPVITLYPGPVDPGYKHAGEMEPCVYNSWRGIFPNNPGQVSWRGILSNNPGQVSCRGILPNTPERVSWKDILPNNPEQFSWPSIPVRSHKNSYTFSHTPSFSSRPGEHSPVPDTDTTRTSLDRDYESSINKFNPLRPLNREYTVEPDRRFALGW